MKIVSLKDRVIMETDVLPVRAEGADFNECWEAFNQAVQLTIYNHDKAGNKITDEMIMLQQQVEDAKKVGVKEGIYGAWVVDENGQWHGIDAEGKRLG